MVAVDLHNRMVVSSPEWNQGEPVRIQDAHETAEHQMVVRWQDARGRGGIIADEVPAGMELTLVSGGCIGGGR